MREIRNLADDKTLVIDLRGGLGNQLSGWFSGRLLAAKLGRRYSVSVTHTNSDLQNGIWSIGIEVFGVPARDRGFLVRAFLHYLRWFQIRLELFFKPAFQFFRRRILGIHVLDQSMPVSCQLDRIAKSKKVRVVRGFFGGCEFLNVFEREIQELAGASAGGDSSWFASMSAQLVAENPISLHLRMGDYRKIPNAVLPTSYFQKALESLLAMESEQSRPTVWIFSDEPDMAKSALGAKNLGTPNLKFIEVPPLVSAWDALRLMSLSRGLICSNSTFSWWAAHLGNQRKTVIAPPLDWPLNPFKECVHCEVSG